AHGEADDFLTTLCLATKAPIVLAPAMNINMWENPATQENLKILRERGFRVVEPGKGYLACGMTGPGRLAEVEDIARAVFAVLHYLDDSTIVLMAAAVADFRPAEVRSQKIKKQSGARSLELVPATDVLAEVSRRRTGQFVVGFAAETENLIENARAKLEAKRL